MNRLAFAISFTENEIEDIQASEASISDADIANKATSFTRAQILSQAATAAPGLLLLGAILAPSHVHFLPLSPPRPRPAPPPFWPDADSLPPPSGLSSMNPTKRFCPNVLR